MAADIVPIELSLPSGDLVTLWAPPWREDGEDWQAFLGDDDALFAFSDVADMVAFARTAGDHDLTDHPAWSTVPQLPAADLVPGAGQRYDLAGVPELITGRPADPRTLSELADTVAIVQAIADVCGLDAVHEVLDAAPDLGRLGRGEAGLGGRAGRKQWQRIRATVIEHWDEVLGAVDGIVHTPQVDQAARTSAEAELEAEPEHEPGARPDPETGPAEAEVAEADPVLQFWSEVGIDPIRIVSGHGEHYTLRCYLDDEPVFLGGNGRIDVFASARGLVRHVAGDPQGNELAQVATWPRVVERATTGELEIRVDDDNSYVLVGVADDLADGPQAVDPVQCGLAVELLADADAWAGDETVSAALAASEPLGWLVSFVLRPDPTRLAPSPPFDAEVAAWRALVTGFEDRLRVH